MDIIYFIHNGNITTVTGDYTAFEDINNNLGTTWEDYLNNKYVMLNEGQVNFLKEHDNTSIKEIYDKTLHDEATEYEKQNLLRRIEEYGDSDEVNHFIINNEKVWISRNLRVSLKNKIQIEKESGYSETAIWLNNKQYNINVDIALDFLRQLELYAIQCFNNTQTLLSEAKQLTLRSEINNFDIKKGYPKILNFNDVWMK